MNAKYLVTATMAGLFTLGHADPLPDTDLLRRADVTLPFSEVRQLLDAAAAAKAKPDEAPPPVASAVTGATIQLSLDAARPAGTAQFTVNVLDKGWQVVPLMGTAFTLTGVTPADAVVIPRDGMLCLLANHPGVMNLTLSFDIPKGLVSGAGGPLVIKVAPSAVGKIAITKPPAGKRVTVNGEPLQADASGQLPAAGGDIRIAFQEDRPVTPTDWTSESATLVTRDADHLDVESRIRLTGDSGSGVSATALLPAEASEVEAEGADLKPVQFASVSDAGRTANLEWTTVGVLDRDVTIRFRIPLPEPGRDWKIVPPVFGQGHSRNDIIVVAPAIGTDLSGSSGGMESAIDRLPYWMQGKIPGENYFVARMAGPVSVHATLLPRLSADSARISEANFATRLVADGAMLCEAKVRVQHRGGLQWRFKLPEGSTLLKCEVDGTPENPLICDNGDLETAIPASGNPNEENPSDVSLSYTAKNAKFDPVQGKLSVSLPSTGLFIENLAWTLSLPDAYEATAFDGNVEIDSSSHSGLIQFRKQLSRDEAPQVEIYYRKHNLNP